LLSCRPRLRPQPPLEQIRGLGEFGNLSSFIQQLKVAVWSVEGVAMNDPAPARLVEIASQVRGGQRPEETVRNLLHWFDSSRRGYWVVKRIRGALSDVGLRTEPDFEGIYVDSPVAFVPDDADQTGGGDSPASEPRPVFEPTNADHGGDGGKQTIEPAYRIGRLPSANRRPVTVAPDATINQAVTLMLGYDYSQLPVMTNDRDVKGVINWKTIGSRLALGRSCDRVSACMEAHQELRSESSLFDAIQVILRFDSVLVRNKERVITGIITASDISLQFRQLAEPFLLIGEIENWIRLTIDRRFRPEELGLAKHPGAVGRTISSAADLAFGEYLRLLGTQENWSRLGIRLDRTVFLRVLDEVREIRNDVMHFDPDPLDEGQLEKLRSAVRFMEEVQSLVVDMTGTPT
jgi:CBS domain-containing protein